MARVICTLPNASMHIGGIDFEPHDLGVISKDDVPIEVAEKFAKIPGYKLELKAAKKAAGETEEQNSAKLAKDKKRLADKAVDPVAPKEEDKTADGESESKGE